MKVIIDIPKETYDRIMSAYVSFSGTTEGVALKSIHDGVLFEDFIKDKEEKESADRRQAESFYRKNICGVYDNPETS